MERKHRFRGMFVFVSAFFILLTSILCNNTTNIMKAETVVDDSPSGEKIVDIEEGSAGSSYYALTEKGQIYAWGRNTSGELGRGTFTPTGGEPKPAKVLNATTDTSGNKYLSNVKKIYADGEAARGIVFALTDTALYAWGNNEKYALGLPLADKYNIPTKVTLPAGVTANDIKDISSNPDGLTTTLLTNSGDVYVIGSSSNGSYGIGLGPDILRATQFTKIDKMVDGNPMPYIKEIESASSNMFFLSVSGNVVCTGYGNSCANGLVTNYYDYPVYMKVNTTDKLENIINFIGSAGGFTLLMRSENGVIYDIADTSSNPIPATNKYASPIPSAPRFVDTYNVFQKHNYFNPRTSNGLFVGQDNKIYEITNFSQNAFGWSNNNFTVSPYTEGAIIEGYSNAKKIIGNYSTTKTMILTNEGSVYLDGVKMSFGAIQIGAKKKNNTTYKDSETYNDDVTLTIKPSINTINDVRYYEKDLLTNKTEPIQTATSSKALTINEGERFYKQYDYFINGEEADTKTTLTVDLYKKTISLSDVSDGVKYLKGKTIALSDNGFSGNTVTATLSKDGGSEVAYTSGSAINDVGNYVLKAIDLYGNTTTYSFSIADIPIPKGVVFDKASGDLTYGNAITKKDGIIGSLSLTYESGMDTSTIKTLQLETGGNESSFEVVNTNQLKVKGLDLNAQEYTLNVSGTDQNDMAFTGQVKFTVAKATQTMDFDSASKAFSSGKKMGDVFTLGTENVLGSATVNYSADSCATLSDKQVTITCVPASGKITFSASATKATNYNDKTVTLDIPISALEVSLKTQSLNGTYEDSVKIKLGDTIPNPQVVVVSPSGFDISKLGTPTFSYKQGGVSVAKPQNKVGSYDVDVSFSNDDGYTLNITKGTLIVEAIEINDANKDDYFTLISGGKTYLPGTWTKDPIVITPKHANFNKMKVAGGSETSSAFTYQSEGTKDVTLSFSNVDGISVSTTVKLNYDKTVPTMNDFTYEKPKSKVRSMFDHFFGEQKTVVFNATDTGSGIKQYDYEIYELDASGNRIASSKTSGQGSSYTLSINKAYEITAKATDNAGNISSVKSEKVTLSDNIGKLDITAMSDGKTYDGSTWTYHAIDFTLHGTNISGVAKYQYSENGIVFKDMSGSTISLPSPLANVDNMTYTFRAINNDGSTNDETFILKVDKEKPVIEVKGKVSSGDYDGSEVSEDVEIVPSQATPNISGITYYYTKDASIKDSNPLSESKWIKQSGTIFESSNGNVTYYVKGVSGAGLVSDVQSLDVKILKRSYTTVNVNVTSGGKPYTPDTWAKGDVTFTLSGGIADESMITGYEYAITADGKVNASTTWKPVTGKTLVVNTNTNGQVYSFRVLPTSSASTISKPTIVKLDVEKPSTPVLTLKELNTSSFAKFVNAISFGNWMKEGVEVTFTSSDQPSGLDYYAYSESIDGVKTDKIIKSGILTYDKDSKIQINAKAVDKAGNISDVSETKEVLIDKVPPKILGVKDQGEYKHYYLPRFISVSDALSGIHESSIQKGSETPIIFTDEISVKDIGTYSVRVDDNAGNETSLIFKLVPLPSLDEIDGSDESKAIIDQIQKELDEVKTKIDETEKEDYQDWLDDANEKWDTLRKKVIEDEDKTSKVEGVGDITFDPKVELVVEPIDETTLPVLPKKALYSYDVYLRKGTTIIQPNGDIKVYLPYPDEETPIVYEIGKVRSVREIPSQKENDYVVFVTDTLQKYAISNTKQDDTKEDVVKVPGPDGELDTKDDVIANPSDKGDKPTKNPDGSVQVPPGGSVSYPDGGVINTPDGGILNPDGSLTLPDGTVIGPDGKPKVDDVVKVPGPDGKLDTKDDVIANPSDKGDKPTKNPDGSVQVPPGGSVSYPDGGVINTPDGGILNPDGSLTLPDGSVIGPDGKPKVDDVVKVPGPDGELDTKDDVIANPSDKGDKPTKNPDGSVQVPPGGSVSYPDGIVIDTPDGAILNPDGSLTLPDGTVIGPDGKPKPDKDVNVDSDGDGKPDVNVDVDCDGKADINIDTNEDGLPDINIDTTGDGKPNYNVDLDGDKKPDLNIGPVKWKTDKCVSGGCVLYCTSTYYRPYLNIDSDGDQRPDINVDLNGDRFADINIDIDGDYIPDVDIDSTGDGKANINVDTNDDGRPDESLVILLKWASDMDVNGSIAYDTMRNIVVDEALTPDTWHPSNEGNTNDNGGYNITKPFDKNAIGGTTTGDITSAIGTWILFILSAGVSYALHRVKKRNKMMKF